MKFHRKWPVFVAAALLLSSGSLFADDSNRGAARISAPDIGGRAVPRTLTIRDNQDQVVGVALNQWFSARQVGDDWIAFLAGRSGPINDGQEILFASEDCSGQAFVRDIGGLAFQGLFGWGILAGDKFLYGTPGTAVIFHAHSARGIDNGGNIGACYAYEDIVVPERRAPMQVLQLAAPVETPFHLTLN